MGDDYLLTIENVYNVVGEHLKRLDELWPDSEPHGPRKVHIVELIDAIKLRLVQQAEKNGLKYESAFEKAAKKITGYKPPVKKPTEEPAAPIKTSSQLAHEEMQARIRSRQS